MLPRIADALHRSISTLAISGFIAIGLAPVALAAPPGDIVLGDITVMRLTTPVGNVTAEQRASMVQDRINQAISIPNLADKDVRLVVEPSGPTIYVRKIKIVTIDPATAAAEGVTPIVLARTWTHRLMGVIGQVCIRVPVAPPAGGPKIAATAPTGPADSSAKTAAGTAAVNSSAAAPAAGSGTAATSPATAPTAPVAAPASPASPTVPAQPPTPLDPAKPVPPASPVTPAPTTPKSNPTAPPAPTTPPAAPPTTPPVTPPVTPPATPPASAIG